ncbi:9306_t:CDS:2 [Acaulospora morrowiae]|uniref:9306_t:CDS:1 n=1 Tax=Acaulospora morrowiae TaxID=94023 RepID=A0A9N9FJM5_9GLOM|nr:9306_t:CDS:2 [Acaulospora morrowiae]
MDPKLLVDLSQSFSNLFQDPQLADVFIEIGKPPETKTFSAHSGLLFARSPHFASELKNEWVKRKKGNEIKFVKPNISPRIFEIVLRYIYTGAVSLENQNILSILEILTAADELLLEDLIQYIQSFLLEHRKELLQKNFATVSQFVFKHENFKRLQEYYSTLLKYSDIRQIDSWINGNDTAQTSLVPITHKYNLICRGSRDGFTADNFHRICDDKGPTVIVIKTNKNDQIIGGYSLASWHSRGRSESGVGCFIFSLGDRNGRDPILSRHASGQGIACWKTHGPVFGDQRDLVLFDERIQNGSNNYTKKQSYKVAILSGAELGFVGYNVQEYEVFQVVDKLLE